MAETLTTTWQFTLGQHVRWVKDTSCLLVVVSQHWHRSAQGSECTYGLVSVGAPVYPHYCGYSELELAAVDLEALDG